MTQVVMGVWAGVAAGGGGGWVAPGLVPVAGRVVLATWGTVVIGTAGGASGDGGDRNGGSDGLARVRVLAAVAGGVTVVTQGECCVDTWV